MNHKKYSLFRRGLVTGLTAALALPACSQVGYIVTDLGVISGATTSNARGINNSGQIIFSTRYLLSGAGGTATQIPGFIGGTGTPSAEGLNGIGQVVGFANNTSGVAKAFIWSGGDLVELGALGPTLRSEAYDVNQSGIAVGVARTGSAASTARAALFSNGSAINLAVGLPAASSRANAISDSGVIVGQSRLVGGTTSQPVIFNGLGGAVGLDLFGTYDRGGANDINEAGVIAGVVSRLTLDTQVGVIWNAATRAVTPLARPIGSKSSFSATSINLAGDVIGGGTLDGSISRSMVYQNNIGYVLQNLVLNRPDGWVFRTTPTGINDAGQIVGTAEIDGVQRAYLLTPAPGQGTLLAGVINVQDFAGPRFTPNFTFTLVPTNGGSPIVMPEVGLSGTGEFVLMTGETGTYDLFIEGSTFLRTRVGAGLVLSNGANYTSLTASMQNGDADESGEVDAADIDLVIQNFGLTSADGPFYDNLGADLDGSNEIDAADIDVAISNFGATDE